MCRSSSTRQYGAGLHFRHLFADQPPAAAPKSILQNAKSRLQRPIASKSKARISPIRNSNGLDRATVARMSHLPQIVLAVHNRPAAQLIFAHLAGMFMVNVVAGGRSYRNNAIAARASRRSSVWRSFRVFRAALGALQQRVRGGACVGQCGCASKKLGAARHIIARAGLRSWIRSRFVIGRMRRRPGLLACSRAYSD